jgi:hypothetical protein
MPGDREGVADPGGDRLFLRFLPHLLHELANLRTLAGSNLELELEDGRDSPFLAKARDSLERTSRLEDALRFVVRPLPKGSEWDVGEATGAVLGLLRCASRDGRLRWKAEPFPALAPLESDRRAFCEAFLEVGLSATEDASESAPRDVVVAVSGGPGGSGAVLSLRGTTTPRAALARAATLLGPDGGTASASVDEVVLRLLR